MTMTYHDELREFGWTAVSSYGYTHPTGWSIGVYRVRDRWVTLLWDAHSIYDEYSDPLAAARHHAALTSEDARGTPTQDVAQLTELTGVVAAQP
ncbi:MULTISPECIES: hypothetical protein [pseudomallei group]|uniref:hypothetical protein n=1 Tax=pseudomallei group TaxID=111527 RepID=UPI0012E8D3C5|nr:MULTISPECIES: hypothetical protein [pseudomallei group]MCS3401047.1 hypothetical protein [Burkholderia thailandensis]MCV9914861.1 hypothetical protein [Burkholderia pseudomallei]MCW0071128.1 hypothetical protein [Burkholderia pseudomallei]MDW9241204.1 hypothetical protein [Burkholderia thailandensis]MUV28213.1 hypothetical protein [Burkholderia thailandensis]